MQFQLTINLVALIVAFVAALTNGETPLNVLQLLWVNLIMDSLAALGALMPAPCCGVHALGAFDGALRRHAAVALAARQ